MVIILVARGDGLVAGVGNSKWDEAQANGACKGHYLSGIIPNHSVARDNMLPPLSLSAAAAAIAVAPRH